VKLLTINNTPYNLDCVPDEVESVDDCLRYCVVDTSDKNYIDYFFVPLIFLESFYAPAIVLNINGHKIKMPLDWSILICDEHFNEMDIMPLTEINDRGFKTVVYNPLKSMMPIPVDVEIADVYTSVKWHMPKLKYGHLLPVPIEDKEKPLCAYFVRDANKVSTPFDPAHLFE